MAQKELLELIASLEVHASALNFGWSIAKLTAIVSNINNGI